MIPHDYPILPDDESDRRTPTGFMPPRDDSELVRELADGTFEVNF